MARILVAGGSLGGLFVANMLLRDGHDVRVIEKVKGSMNGRGAGIVSHDALVNALERLDLDVQSTLGVLVPGRVLLDGSGNALQKLDMPQVLTSWSRLYQILLEAFPAERYLQGVAVQRVEQDEREVRVSASRDNSELTFEADLLIACDGIRSSIRQQVFPNTQPHYAGYIAWRGVCEESLLSDFTLNSLFDYFGFCVPADEQIIGYPVAGPNNDTRRGQRAYNFVWYRPMPQGDELRNILTDADGNHYTQGIPPHKVSWRQIAKAREDARNLLSPQFAEILEKTAQPFLQPIYDLASDQVVSGRIAIMGDAAFVARPHIGMGVTKAAEDATAISDSIRLYGASSQAMAAYSEKRLRAGRSAIQRARWLGDYIKSADSSSKSIVHRQHLMVNETAIDLGRYGHLSTFKENEHFTLNGIADPKN
jgi:2-polyprenyl-6-methoxyphenol hydroxylase-like FAD-dependent oxidoreductase